MKKIMILLVLGCFNIFAQGLPEKYASCGRVIVAPLESAPFPHPLRADGHKYDTNFFSAATNYSDSDVVFFIPKDFHARGKTDFVFFFHGWSNTATNALPRYGLVDQFFASKRNAILIVPQGPWNAKDSFDGKLEDAGGFKRFMAEAVKTLEQRDVIKSDKIGKIILSGHSGGYEAISSIVAWGGLSDHIREVWLFDALYGNTERFVVWFDHHKSRFVDIYTDDGGTTNETKHLMASLKDNEAPYFFGEDTNATAKNLRENHLVFLHTSLPHDDVPRVRQAFRRFLETSALDEIHH